MQYHKMTSQPSCEVCLQGLFCGGTGSGTGSSTGSGGDSLAGSSPLTQELMARHRQEELYASLDVSVLEVKGLQPRKGASCTPFLPDSLQE